MRVQLHPDVKKMSGGHCMEDVFGFVAGQTYEVDAKRNTVFGEPGLTITKDGETDTWSARYFTEVKD